MVPFSADDLSKHTASLRILARDLLADDALADDAVQQAWVTALTRPPAAPVSVGAWLRAVVRSCALDLWRSERRRHAREQLVARDEAGEEPDAAELLELQEDIVAAVRSLDEPYRTAVWLRYYEDRTPTAIAQALGEPVKTVKTRLGRALQLLRHKLDGRYGDRAKWATSLVPLARWSPRTGSFAALATAGGLLMQSKGFLVAAAGVLLLAAGAWWTLQGGAAPPTPERPNILPVAAANPEQGVPTEPGGSTGRELVPAATTATVSAYGSLLVRVHWHDGAPAADIAIHAVVEGEPQEDHNELRFLSNADGVARAERVHAGKVRLGSDRGGALATEIVGGALREVDFVLPRGVDIDGTVLDERERPVMNAQVVIVSPRAGWLGGSAAATTGAAGTFVVRAVDPKWSLGARAQGYAPSALVDLEDLVPPANGAPVRVQLRLLQAGASVTGNVVDDSGAPIAGAIVVLGRGSGGHYEPPRIRETWSPHVIVSGEDGAFRCDGVEPGAQPIAARADGCSRATDTLTCAAGSTTTITLVLGRGVTVRGTVRNEAGDPVADALVTTVAVDHLDLPVEFAIKDNSEIKRSRTRTDAAGAFVLRGAPVGTLQLLAAKAIAWGKFEGVCHTAMDGRVGDTLTWNPVLVAGKTLRVRVVNADGEPTDLPGPLDAYAEQPAGWASYMKVFSEASRARGGRSPGDLGSYVFTNCADVPYTISPQNMGGAEDRLVYQRGVIPGGPEVELRLPREPAPGAPGEVAGRIVDVGHRIAGGSLSVSLCTPASRGDTKLDGDRFHVGGIAPGRYFLWVRVDGVPILVGPSFDLQPGQKLDLGDVATQPGGTVRVALRTPGGIAVTKPAAHLGESWEWRQMKWDGSHFVADNVTVGRYCVILRTPDWFAPQVDVDVVAGQERVVTLDVVPGALRRFRITMPYPDQWSSCEFVVRDARGLVLATSSPRRTFGLDPHRWQVTLPFAACTLEAVLDGQRRTWPMDLRNPATADSALKLSLR